MTLSGLALVVRRGARSRFLKLKQKTKHLPIKLLWDRRRGERRTRPTDVSGAKSDRRKTDRRKKAPFTWDLADFVVAGHADQRRRRARAKEKS